VFAGDIESAPFIEALGQFSYRVGKYLFPHTIESKRKEKWILWI
jgi:CTP synthase (UTP-ammonia lyase)